MLKAGVASVDISPKLGVQLAGYPHKTRENTGVHNPILATALYLTDGKENVMFVNTELLYFGKQYLKVLRSEFPDINLLVTSTHTHCAPWASGLLPTEIEDGFEVNEEYMSFLMDCMRKVIGEAKDNLFDAYLGFGITKCGAEMGVGGNRHHKGGACDPSLGTIAIKDSEGKIRYIMSNYALHPTLLHGNNTEVTGDYPSYTRRFLEFAYPGAIFGFTQGCSGDQSTRYHRVGQNFEEAARVGTTVGVEIFHTIEKMEFTNDVPLTYKTEEIELPFKNFPTLEEAEAQLKDAEELWKATENADFTTHWNAELRLYGRQATKIFSRLVQEGYVSPELPLQICYVKLGDKNILTSQGELFVEIGMRIKALLDPEKTLFFETTNGAAPGYIYSEEGAREGGYEYGNSMFREDAHAIICEEFKKLINK